MLTANSLAINRLQIKGDRRSSQKLLRELEQTSWAKPLPASLQHAWILVRELHVSGTLFNLKQQTAQHLAGELQHAMRAIHGNAQTANVIWFATLPELIAFLAVDLALGKTTQWYWAHWVHILKYSRQEAAARLLCENIEHLPAVIAQLQSRQQLQLVFSCLSSGGASSLVSELARVRGLRITGLWDEKNSAPDSIEREIHSSINSQSKLFNHWRQMLQGMNVKDGRVMLAAVVHGITYLPLWVQLWPTTFLKAMMATLCSESRRKPDSHQQTVSSALQVRDEFENGSIISDGDVRHDKSHVASNQNNKQRAAELDESILDQHRSFHSLSRDESFNVLPKGERFLRDEGTGTANKSSTDLSKQERDLAPVVSGDKPKQLNIISDGAELGCYEFKTRAGGFFYLLNPLRNLLTEERLSAQKDCSVWHWLLDLSRLFAQKFPSVAEIIDAPLQKFLLRQLRPELSALELQSYAKKIMAIPPSSFAGTLFSKLESHYANTGLWKELNESPGFFAVPAQVIATASHWDVYFSLQAVRLDLRMMGWDVNPGWLGWLGRVVTLHYVEQTSSLAPEQKP